MDLLHNARIAEWCMDHWVILHPLVLGMPAESYGLLTYGHKLAEEFDRFNEVCRFKPRLCLFCMTFSVYDKS